eukprot:936090-Prymnesium_polylepis.1
MRHVDCSQKGQPSASNSMLLRSRHASRSHPILHMSSPMAKSVLTSQSPPARSPQRNSPPN